MMGGLVLRVLVFRWRVHLVEVPLSASLTLCRTDESSSSLVRLKLLTCLVSVKFLLLEVVEKVCYFLTDYPEKNARFASPVTTPQKHGYVDAPGFGTTLEPGWGCEILLSVEL